MTWLLITVWLVGILPAGWWYYETIAAWLWRHVLGGYVQEPLTESEQNSRAIFAFFFGLFWPVTLTVTFVLFGGRTLFMSWKRVMSWKRAIAD